MKYLKDIFKKKKETDFTRNFMYAIGFVAVATLIFIGICIWGIYTRGWSHAGARIVSELIPLPAIELEGSYIPVSEYLSVLDSQRVFYQKQLEAGNFEQLPEEEISERAKELLIFNYYVYKLADEYDVSLGDDAVDQEIDAIVSRLGNKDELRDYLREWYNWTIPEYKRLFLEPAILYVAVNDHIKTTNEDNKVRLRQMEAAQAALDAGEEFQTVAQEYGAAETEESPGEIFIMSRGTFPPDIEDEIITMDLGSVSEILSLRESLQIIKVEGRDETSGLLTLRRIYQPLYTVEDEIFSRRSAADIQYYLD